MTNNPVRPCCSVSSREMKRESKSSIVVEFDILNEIYRFQNTFLLQGSFAAPPSVISQG